MNDSQVYLIGAFVLALLAFLPASIAQSKGKSFGAWWLYGFLLWIVAIFHAIFLPELTDSNTQSNQLSKVKSVSVSLKTDINSPLHIIDYEILRASNGESTAIKIHIQNLNKNIIEAIKFIAVGFNSFGEKITVNESETFDILMQDLNLPNGNEFTNNIPISLPREEIRLIELNVEQIKFANGEVYHNVPEIISINPKLIPEEFSYYAQLLINSARYYPEHKDAFWVCTCGYVNRNDSDNCALCETQKETAFAQITPENIELFKNKEDERAATQQQTERKEEKQKLIVVIAGVILFFAVMIIAIIISG